MKKLGSFFSIIVFIYGVFISAREVYALPPSSTLSLKSSEDVLIDTAVANIAKTQSVKHDSFFSFNNKRVILIEVRYLSAPEQSVAYRLNGNYIFVTRRMFSLWQELGVTQRELAGIGAEMDALLKEAKGLNWSPNDMDLFLKGKGDKEHPYVTLGELKEKCRLINDEMRCGFHLFLLLKKHYPDIEYWLSPDEILKAAGSIREFLVSDRKMSFFDIMRLDHLNEWFDVSFNVFSIIIFSVKDAMPVYFRNRIDAAYDVIESIYGLGKEANDFYLRFDFQRYPTYSLLIAEFLIGFHNFCFRTGIKVDYELLRDIVSGVLKRGETSYYKNEIYGLRALFQIFQNHRDLVALERAVFNKNIIDLFDEIEEKIFSKFDEVEKEHLPLKNHEFYFEGIRNPIADDSIKVIVEYLKNKGVSQNEWKEVCNHFFYSRYFGLTLSKEQLNKWYETFSFPNPSKDSLFRFPEWKDLLASVFYDNALCARSNEDWGSIYQWIMGNFPVKYDILFLSATKSMEDYYRYILTLMDASKRLKFELGLLYFETLKVNFEKAIDMKDNRALESLLQDFIINLSSDAEMIKRFSSFLENTKSLLGIIENIDWNGIKERLEEKELPISERRQELPVLYELESLGLEHDFSGSGNEYEGVLKRPYFVEHFEEAVQNIEKFLNTFSGKEIVAFLNRIESMFLHQYFMKHQLIVQGEMIEEDESVTFADRRDYLLVAGATEKECRIMLEVKHDMHLLDTVKYYLVQRLTPQERKDYLNFFEKQMEIAIKKSNEFLSTVSSDHITFINAVESRLKEEKARLVNDYESQMISSVIFDQDPFKSRSFCYLILDRKRLSDEEDEYFLSLRNFSNELYDTNFVERVSLGNDFKNSMKVFFAFSSIDGVRQLTQSFFPEHIIQKQLELGTEILFIPELETFSMSDLEARELSRKIPLSVQIGIAKLYQSLGFKELKRLIEIGDGILDPSFHRVMHFINIDPMIRHQQIRSFLCCIAKYGLEKIKALSIQNSISSNRAKPSA